MAEMLERSRRTWPSRTDEMEGSGWFDALRWMPREFRDWVANDGMRIEEIHDETGLTVRAEVPGVDPTVDVDVCVVDGSLVIEARRRESKQETTNGQRRSEFHYGDFYRRLPLPDGAKTDEVSATYDKGILVVNVPIEESTESRVKVVPVEAVPANGTD